MFNRPFRVDRGLKAWRGGNRRGNQPARRHGHHERRALSRSRSSRKSALRSFSLASAALSASTVVRSAGTMAASAWAAARSRRASSRSWPSRSPVASAFASMSLSVAVFVLLRIPETNPYVSRGAFRVLSMLGSYIQLVQSRRYLGYLSIAAVTVAGSLSSDRGPIHHRGRTWGASK